MLIKNFHFKSVGLNLSICASIIAITYYYPRYLIKYLGEDSPWLGYFYTYGMGFIFFALSVLWIFTRKKSALRAREELLWLILVVLGLICTFSMQGLWILLSLSFPVKF